MSYCAFRHELDTQLDLQREDCTRGIRFLETAKTIVVLIGAFLARLFIREGRAVRFVSALCTWGVLVAATAFAQPKIAALENNYSYILPGMPNYGIAQGSIFDIFGTGLSTISTSLQSVPLQTTLNGVTVNVSVAGTTKQAILYYVTPGQIAAILPSATPVGIGQITVTVNGQSTVPVPIQVVQSAFGMLTLNGAGSGPAAAFDANSNYLAFTNAANPGDYITLWGSGLGPVSGDETKAQAPANLTNIPVEVEIGGNPAIVQYRGRSAYPGLDQINVVVPPTTPGCYVSVVVRSGNIVSNFASIPVATSGRTCSDQITGIPTNALQTLGSKNSFNLGTINVDLNLVTSRPVSAGNSTATLSGAVTFAGYTASQFKADTLASITSLGSCVVYDVADANETVTNPIKPTPLSAGSYIIATLPVSIGGSPPVTPPPGVTPGPTPPGISNLKYQVPLKNGSYTFSSANLTSSDFGNDIGATYYFNSASGSDVGPFDVGPFAAQIGFGGSGGGVATWTNMDAITSVNRSQGVTVTWTGGSGTGYIKISGTSITTIGTSVVGAIFYCSSLPGVGQFTVPTTVLLALPASTTVIANGAAVPSSLSVGAFSGLQPFAAPGVDLGLIGGTAMRTLLLNYQ